MNKKWVILCLLSIPAVLFSQNVPVSKLKAYRDIKHGNYQSAIDSLDILIKEKPDQDLYLAKAEALYFLEDFENALDYCDKADKMNAFASSQLRLKIFLKQENYDQVKQTLEENLRSEYKIPLFELYNNPDFTGIYNLNFNDYILSANFYSQTEKQIYQVQ